MDSLDAIKHQINAGDREGAQLALREILKTEPDSADAWRLLAILLSDPSEKAECYRQILRVNPDDRHAAAWLEALKPEMRRSPFGSVPVDSQPGEAMGAGAGPIEEVLGSPEQDLELPGAKDSVPRQPSDQEEGRTLSEGLGRRPDTPSKSPGLLDRIMGRRQRSQPPAGSLISSLDEGDAEVQPGSLNPADILRMAGGPLPPEDRRKCHECGAVVSRNDLRCPWCSASLQHDAQA
jgi:hypothetical protein